jgi:hypothetical protein
MKFVIFIGLLIVGSSNVGYAQQNVHFFQSQDEIREYQRKIQNRNIRQYVPENYRQVRKRNLYDATGYYYDPVFPTYSSPYGNYGYPDYFDFDRDYRYSH